MTPQFKPGDYVRAVQITGLWGRWHEGHIMKVGRLVAIHDTESYWGSYEVAFGNGMKYMVLEIEPATKADYDADWPEEEPAMPEPHCSECHKPSLSVICDECVSKAVGNIVGYPTASAVLTAGNDPGLQFLRTQLKQAEQNLEFYERRVADEKQLENTILDLIAARMDQLKGEGKCQ